MWSLLALLFLLLSIADGEEKIAQKRDISLLGFDSGFDYDGHGIYGGGDFGPFSNSLLLDKPSTVHVPHPYPVDRPVPVPHPYPVFINKPVPYPVHIPIETPVPYPVPYPTGIHAFGDGGSKHHAAPLAHEGSGGGKGHKHFGHHLAHLVNHFSHHFKHKF